MIGSSRLAVAAAALCALTGATPGAAGGDAADATRAALERLEQASDRAWEETVRALGAGEGRVLRGLRWDLWNVVTVVEREADRMLGRAREDDRPPELAWDLLRLERRIATMRWLAPRAGLDPSARQAVERLGEAADALVALHRAEIDRLEAERSRGLEPARLTRRQRARLLRAIGRLGEEARRLERAVPRPAPPPAAAGAGAEDEGDVPLVPLDDERVFLEPNDDRWRRRRVADAALELLDFATLAAGLEREAAGLDSRELVLRLLTLVRVQRAVVRSVAAAEADLPRELIDRWNGAREALGEATRVVGVPLPVS